MLQDEFFSLVKKYTSESATAAHLWSELQSANTADGRYFHTLTHLGQMLEALQAAKMQIEDWDTVAFAVFYHDYVYDVVRYVNENDNEDLSAAQAEKALQAINYPPEKIERCKQHILATKHHKPSADPDTNFITDADLLVLGLPWKDYKMYMENIRREYEVFPDKIYYAGRATVLKNFLRSDPLFKTPSFQKRYAAQAKENLERELEIVSFY